MAHTEWTRADRIAVVGVLIAVVSCVAAIVVVPEFRHWLGLGRSDAETTLPPVNQANMVPAKVPDTKEVPKGDQSKGELNKIWLEPNEKGETQEAEVMCCLLRNDADDTSNQTRQSKIQLINMSLYPNKRVYLKLSICNDSHWIAQLKEIFLWYSSGVQESVNWHFSGDTAKKPLLQLKPAECRIVGGWSDEVNESFRLMRPLGQLSYSNAEYRRLGSLDLAAFDQKGFVRVIDSRSR